MPGRLIPLFLSVCMAATAQTDTSSAIAQPTTPDTIPPPAPPPIRFTTETALDHGTDILLQPDTSLAYFHRYDPATGPLPPSGGAGGGPFTAHLGNIGSVTRSLVFGPGGPVGFDYGYSALQPYVFDGRTVPYYRVRSPYTELNYVMGAKEEQIFHLTHSQNITRKINAAVHYRRISSPGFYNRSHTSHSNLFFSSWYRSENERYTLLFNAVLNKLSAQESGGLANAGDFENNITPNRRLLAVNLAEAETRWRSNGLYLKQYLNFGRAGTDTANTCCRSGIRHSFQYEKKYFVYEDKFPASGQYPSILLDSLQTLDSSAFERFRNRLGWYAGNALRFSVEADHYLVKVSSLARDTSIQDLALGASLDYSPGKTRILLTTKYVLSGYNAENYRLNLTLRRKAGEYRVYVAAGLTAGTSSFIQEAWRSNHFAWESLFEQMQVKYGGFGLWNEAKQLDFSSYAYLVDNYIYFNASGYPSQAQDGFIVYVTKLDKTFRWRKWGLDNSAAYQYATTQDLVHLPAVLLAHSLYYEIRLFKNALLARFGADVTYHSAFFADAWMPATGQFTVQDATETGGYPYIDLFLSLGIKRARIFAKMQHVNAGLSGYSYILTPHYPYPDRAFRLGINWRFYD